jgi:DNA-binding GntR family transcriptional regulator
MGEVRSARDGQSGAFAYEQLRAAILSGKISPGHEIAQVDLATQLGVGRTPLREAIRVLQEEGLLVSEPNRRVSIAEFSIEDVEGLYVMRMALESIAVLDTVPLLTPEQIGEMEGMLATMAHFASRQDFERTEPPHRRFHEMLVSAGGARMTRLISQLSDHAERYRRAYLGVDPARYQLSTEEHRAILDAAADHQPDIAADRLVSHYLRTAQSVIAKLGPNYDPRRLLAHGHALIGQALDRESSDAQA